MLAPSIPLLRKKKNIKISKQFSPPPASVVDGVLLSVVGLSHQASVLTPTSDLLGRRGG